MWPKDRDVGNSLSQASSFAGWLLSLIHGICKNTREVHRNSCIYQIFESHVFHMNHPIEETSRDIYSGCPDFSWWNHDILNVAATNIATSISAQGSRRWRKFQNRKPIGDVRCCESRMAERIHWLTERWLELCLLEWLQWLQWSPHPQLLDVVSCTATVVVVVA